MSAASKGGSSVCKHAQLCVAQVLEGWMPGVPACPQTSSFPTIRLSLLLNVCACRCARVLGVSAASSPPVLHEPQEALCRRLANREAARRMRSRRQQQATTLTEEVGQVC